MIVRETSGQTYRVTGAGPGLEHCWMGVPVKRTPAGFAPKSNARPRLVRRAGCVIVARRA
jgi:hypothetical protein